MAYFMRTQNGTKLSYRCTINALLTDMGRWIYYHIVFSNIPAWMILLPFVVRQLRSAWVTHLGKSLIFCMVVDIVQTKHCSRKNQKFSAAILDFGPHFGFWHSRMKICLSWEPLSVKYHVIPLFIGFRGWQIQWWHYFGDLMYLRRVTS